MSFPGDCYQCSVPEGWSDYRRDQRVFLVFRSIARFARSAAKRLPVRYPPTPWPNGISGLERNPHLAFEGKRTYIKVFINKELAWIPVHLTPTNRTLTDCGSNYPSAVVKERAVMRQTVFCSEVIRAAESRGTSGWGKRRGQSPHRTWRLTRPLRALPRGVHALERSAACAAQRALLHDR
jgi:hypothetical protein